MGSDRRIFLRSAGAIVGCTLGRVGLSEAAEARSGRTATTRKDWDAIIRDAGTASLTCLLTPEMTEGPFYYESSLKRRALAEHHPGERLRLGITLAGMADVNRCLPLMGAVIDVWHTDASGLYSNVGPDLQPVDTLGETFLRGHQLTDENGYVEFETIVPGWEIVAALPPLSVAVRTTHIHVKVFHERSVLTTQLFLPNALLDGIYANTEPYKSHRLMTAPGLTRSFERIANEKDKFYLESKAHPMTVTRENGVLFAKANIGIQSQGNRGFAPLFR